MTPDNTPPLIQRVSAPEIANIWADDEQTCRGVATEPLNPDRLPTDCRIEEETTISGGKRSFVITTQSE